MQKRVRMRAAAKSRITDLTLLSGFLWLLSVQLLQAQSTTASRLSGVVLAKDGDVLPGSNVVFKGQTRGNPARGTSTDGKGEFTLDAKAGDVLVISAIGYQTTEITVGNQPRITVALTEAASQLNEVVVVGYGTQDRKDLVGRCRR
ncbi:carboxypeptidase-like regulatory domain-containing protein [Spirosoma rhododendri]|uniref:carboxypeptidase-like regulatory domain-containing protein n=1 Tax=Spirosoma rhododendri TaxID=2728024 RepID=UPI0020C2A0F8|nr:carboxypeptidase-like regulatory domain-containing protein [Spirosoma rhododendri]